MDFVERIDEKLKEKNVKRVSMCEDIGIDTSIMTAWKKRGTIPAADICLKIADYLGTSVEYLVTGKEKEGKVLPEATSSELSEEEERLLALFRLSSPEQRKIIQMQLELNAKETSQDLALLQRSKAEGFRE